MIGKPEPKIGQRYHFAFNADPNNRDSFFIGEITSIITRTNVALKVLQKNGKEWEYLAKFPHENVQRTQYTYLEGQDRA